jgi:uncharacterized protein (TIGR03905 family)
MSYTFIPNGICPREIDFDITDGIVTNVKFNGGCNGNGKGLAALIDGMPVQDVIAKLKNITCEKRGTSCPAELARALSEKMSG